MQEVEADIVNQLSTLSLAGARKALDAAEAAARQRGLRLCIAVSDVAGNLLAFARMDGAPLVAIAASIQKARTSAQLRCDTRALQDMTDGGQPSLLSVREIMPVEGGVPIVVGGACVGGIGASGSAPQDDASAAKAGAEAFEQ